MVKNMLDFYKGKKVFVTGHTGFKGSWLCTILQMAGAEVTGYALPPEELSLCGIIRLEESMASSHGDVRDLEALWRAFKAAQPEIVLHLAAQPIVRESYRDPVGTYASNVMGTVHILECVRRSGCVRSFLNVTTDKVYENHQWPWGYRETDRLNGFDPYANSKSCSELVTDGYRNSFFSDGAVAVSTARAGNVIGGGDFAADRIIPDCIRAVRAGQPLQLRSPHSVRPYQHVLEPLSAYLLIAQKQYENTSLSGSYNVGPDETDCWTTGDLVTLFCEKWNTAAGSHVTWKNEYDGGPHEANFLKLDCSKLKSVFGWRPRWNVETTMEKIVEWSLVYLKDVDVAECMRKQIEEFLM